MRVGNVDLLAHQEYNVEKLRGLEGALVGDDTGTGKTITCLALVQELLDEGEKGPILIVSNAQSPWARDFGKVGIEGERIHYMDRKARGSFLQELSQYSSYSGHYFVVHWEGMRLEIAKLLKIKWLLVIADEAHKASNRNSARTRALKMLKPRYKIAATADPNDDKPDGIWSSLNWLYPKKFRSYWKFVARHLECETHYKGYTIFGEPINVEEFQALIEPFYVRTTLDDIDSLVPSYEFYDVHVAMTDKQRIAYQEMVDMEMAYLDDDIIVAGTPIEVNMRLQQMASAYGYVTSKWIKKKKNVFVNGKPELKLVDHEQFSVRLVEPSPKLDAAELIACGEIGNQFCVFSQNRDLLTMFGNRLDKAGLSYVSAKKLEDLEEAEKRFQNGDVQIFLGASGVASESIDLTAGDLIVPLDRHWSTRQNNQMLGRIRRLGQRRVPRCIDIRTIDTVDFARLEKVTTKKQWNDMMMGRI